jgi:hypothetical protein
MPLQSPPAAQLWVTAAILAWGLAPAGLVTGSMLRVREVLRRDQWNAADYERIERGYYETLLDAGRSLNAIAGAAGPASARAEPPPFDAGPLGIAVDDLREYILKPNLSAELGGVVWTTNAQGMRDRTYAPVKPPGTVRIALAGDSIAAGWGVDDGRAFEAVLERALDERSRRAGGPAVEVLNFAVPGHGPGQRWDQFTRIGWSMGPDLVLFESTQADAGWDERRLRGLLARGIGFDSRLYRAVLEAAGVRPGWGMDDYRRRLRPFHWELLGGVYRVVAADCRAHGVPGVFLLVPRVGRSPDPVERRRMIALARAAGFALVADLSDAYDGVDPAALAISPRDYHPNAAGHALLARRLDAILGARPELSRVGSGAEGLGTGAGRP